MSNYPQRQKFRHIRQNRQQNFVKSAIFVIASISGHISVPAAPPAVVRPKATTSDELGEFPPRLDLEAPHTSKGFASNLRVCLVN